MVLAEDIMHIHAYQMEKKNNMKLQMKSLQQILQNIHATNPSWRRAIVELYENLPAFLALFSTCKGPVLVVSSEKKSQRLAPVSVAVVSEKETTTLEVTGNPLESPFTSEEMDLIQNPSGYLPTEEYPHFEVFEPLNNTQARIAQMQYAMKVDKIKGDLCPVVFVCDGSDGMQVVLLQSEAPSSGRSFACREENCDTDRMKELRSAARKSCRAHVGLESSVIREECWRYMEHHTALCVGWHNFKLRTIWKETSSNYDTSPPLAASCTLEVPLIKEYDKWEVGDLAEELRILRELVSCLYAPITSDVPITPMAGDCKFDLLSITREIVLAVRTVTMELNENQQEKKEEIARDILVKLVGDVNNNTRPNIDFTDCIWNKFKYCSSISEIHIAMLAILKELLTTDANVLPQNPTFLAAIAERMTVTHDERELPLQTNSVELLLEAGFVKLYRDLVYVCQAGGLRSADEIKHFCDLGKEFKNTSNSKEWYRRIDRLQHIILSLELVLRTVSHFTVNLEVMRLLFSTALCTEVGKIIRINLQSHQFALFYSSHEPYLQRWTFKAINERTKSSATASFICSRKCQFFPWALPLQPPGIPVDFDSTLVLPEQLTPYMFCATLHSICSE